MNKALNDALQVLDDSARAASSPQIGPSQEASQPTLSTDLHGLLRQLTGVTDQQLRLSTLTIALARSLTGPARPPAPIIQVLSASLGALDQVVDKRAPRG